MESQSIGQRGTSFFNTYSRAASRDRLSKRYRLLERVGLQFVFSITSLVDTVFDVVFQNFLVPSPEEW